MQDKQHQLQCATHKPDPLIYRTVRQCTGENKGPGGGGQRKQLGLVSNSALDNHLK